MLPMPLRCYADVFCYFARRYDADACHADKMRAVVAAAAAAAQQASCLPCACVEKMRMPAAMRRAQRC